MILTQFDSECKESSAFRLTSNVLIVNLLCCMTKSGKFTCVLIVVVSSLQVPIEREISVTVVRTDTKKQELPT